VAARLPAYHVCRFADASRREAEIPPGAGRPDQPRPAQAKATWPDGRCGPRSRPWRARWDVDPTGRIHPRRRSAGLDPAGARRPKSYAWWLAPRRGIRGSVGVAPGGWAGSAAHAGHRTACRKTWGGGRPAPTYNSNANVSASMSHRPSRRCAGGRVRDRGWSLATPARRCPRNRAGKPASNGIPTFAGRSRPVRRWWVSLRRGHHHCARRRLTWRTGPRPSLEHERAGSAALLKRRPDTIAHVDPA